MKHSQPPLAQYRFFAALRMIAQDPRYSGVYQEFASQYSEYLPILQTLKDSKADRLTALQKAAYPEYFPLEGDEALWENALTHKPTQVPLFTREWFEANRKPLTIAFAVFAFVCFITLIALPPIGAMLGISALALTASISGMGGFTLGTFMVTLAAPLSLTAFFGAKKYYEKELEPLENLMATKHEIHRLQEKEVEDTCRRPGLFHDWTLPSAPKMPEFVSRVFRSSPGQ